jgi:hypothetical protein
MIVTASAVSVTSVRVLDFLRSKNMWRCYEYIDTVAVFLDNIPRLAFI